MQVKNLMLGITAFHYISVSRTITICITLSKFKYCRQKCVMKTLFCLYQKEAKNFRTPNIYTLRPSSIIFVKLIYRLYPSPI